MSCRLCWSVSASAAGQECNKLSQPTPWRSLMIILTWSCVIMPIDRYKHRNITEKTWNRELSVFFFRQAYGFCAVLIQFMLQPDAGTLKLAPPETSPIDMAWIVTSSCSFQPIFWLRMTNFRNRANTSLLFRPVSLLARLSHWVRREVVDDDPWDVDSLFPEQSDTSLKAQEPKHPLPSKACFKTF